MAKGMAAKKRLGGKSKTSSDIRLQMVSQSPDVRKEKIANFKKSSNKTGLEVHIEIKEQLHESKNTVQSKENKELIAKHKVEMLMQENRILKVYRASKNSALKYEKEIFC